MFKSKNARQGKHKRRLASVYHLFEVEDKCSPLQCPDELNDAGASLIVTDTDGKDVFVSNIRGRMKGIGLVRSQSFPPEGWYKTTSKYILRVRKAWNSEECERRSNNSINELEEDSSNRTILSEPREASSGCLSPMLVETVGVTDLAPEQVCDQSKVPDSDVSPSSAQLCTVTMLPGGGDASAMTTEEETINVHSRMSSSTADMVDTAHQSSPRPSTAETSVSEDCLVPASVIPRSGKVLVCGRRREMEDTAAIVPSFLSCGRDVAQLGKKPILDLHFYGVFDGHGGSQASTCCMERLHLVVAEELLRANALVVPEGGVMEGSNIEWQEIMKMAFAKMDKEVGGVCPNKVGDEDDDGFDGSCLCCEDAIAPENVGTTAVVAIVGLNQVVVANCGDSRAVLARGGQAIPLSRDHKPELEDETRRIEAAGGRVIAWDGYRVGGLLALSRAIGDRYLKRYVISEPETTCIQRSEEDECLILASDGLWDVVSNDFACEVARKSLPALRKKYASRPCAPGKDAASAAVAALLVKLAYGRGSKDNISVVVVDLKSCMTSQ